MTVRGSALETAVRPAKAVDPAAEIVRDIARGGLAGLVAGVVVAGVGGRLVMRLAALLVPSAAGLTTENGNRIGEITVAGSVALIVFVGLLAAVVCGVVWVVISPWLPGGTVTRGIAAVPLAVGAGSFGLIEGTNPDFAVLGHDALVVGCLLGLLALIPIVLSVADGWLDRRLPRPETIQSGAGVGYLGFALLGGTLGGILFIQAVLGGPSRPLGISVIAVGALTLMWWRDRVAGRRAPAPTWTVLARLILVIGSIGGFATLVPELRQALAIG